jgi:hypothetical protein
MLAGLLGTDDAERILLFILSRDRGYGREIADFWGSTQTGTKRQLERLEATGVLMSEPVGRARVYQWNPRYPFAMELKALLRRAIDLLPEADRKRLTTDHRRPRRAGKPL